MNTIRGILKRTGICCIAALLGLAPFSAQANDTGLPPDMVKITGQEDFVYVWTLGVEGTGDEQDKLVTVDVNPNSRQYGRVVHAVSVGGRNEAHHMGFTSDRRYLWGATLDTSKIFVFDIHTNPARPRLIKTITDFVAKSGGVVGPHTIMPMKDRMIITGLSNNRTTAAARLWLNTPLKENTSLPTGCLRMTTSKVHRRRANMRTAMIMTYARCRGWMLCSHRPLPVGPTI